MDCVTWMQMATNVRLPTGLFWGCYSDGDTAIPSVSHGVVGTSPHWCLGIPVRNIHDTEPPEPAVEKLEPRPLMESLAMTLEVAVLDGHTSFDVSHRQEIIRIHTRHPTVNTGCVCAIRFDGKEWVRNLCLSHRSKVYRILEEHWGWK